VTLLLPGAHDHEPEHGRQLPHPERGADGEDLFLVRREQKAGKAERQVGEATDHQPDAEKAGEESRSVHQQAERNEPQAPKDRVGKVEVVMEVEEQNGEGIALRLVED
jgi:hypothetical protein